MVKWTGKRILRLQLYQEVPKLFGGLLSWEHLPFLLGYAVVLHWVRGWGGAHQCMRVCRAVWRASVALGRDCAGAGWND